MWSHRDPVVLPEPGPPEYKHQDGAFDEVVHFNQLDSMINCPGQTRILVQVLYDYSV